jgi:hypothetical protein
MSEAAPVEAPEHVSLPDRRRVDVHYEVDRLPWIPSRLHERTLSGRDNFVYIDGVSVPQAATQPKWTRDGFAPLGLEWNPFGSVQEGELASLSVSDVPLESIIEKLSRTPSEGRFAVEFLGPCGHGKSTHLELLHAHFRDMPMTMLRPEEPIPPIPQAGIVFLDESQLLSRWQRWRLFRRPSHFVLGTHESHVAELGARDIEVFHHEVGRLAPEAFWTRVTAFVERRLRWASRRGAPTPPQVPTRILKDIIARHGQHLRAIQDELYDHYQALADQN